MPHHLLEPNEGNMGTDDIAALQVGLMLEISTMPTAYEPYLGETFTIALGQTVYGGTLDADTGTLTVTWKEADLSDPKFYPTGGNGIRFNNALDSDYADGGRLVQSRGK